MSCGIYKMTNKVNGKIYIGLSVNIETRMYNHYRNAFYEKDVEYMHFFRYAQHAKNVVDRFGEIIVRCDIPDELIDQEGFGFYNMEVSVLPECIIKKENFVKKME
jgi:hypothetical protein